MLLPKEFESVTLPDVTTQTLGPTPRDAFAVFEDLFLLGNVERPQFIQLEYPHRTFAIELIESVLMNYYQLFRKVCLSSPLPIRDLYAVSCPESLHVHSTSSSYTYYNTAFSPCPSRPSPSVPLPGLPSAAHAFFPSCSSNSRPSSRRRPPSDYSSNSLVARLTPVSLGLPGWMRVLVMEIMRR
jgi:Guanine nucleotide exchange factor in Golgi transport N-terminal